MLHSAREQQCQQPVVLMRRSQSISSSCPPNEQISEQIQQEIHRFESVHPCIYDFYDLIDTIDDEALQEQLREQVVYLEDALINSQEWTLGRIIPELKLGVVGSLDSGKTSLVHFFLTGSGRQESPEGGRFKKRCSGQPEFQFTNWIDGVIIVFAVESRDSYQTALQFFKRMTSYRNLSDIPVFLVGTKDTSNENARRVIGEEEARKASQTMKMCGYFECCSAFGHNSEPIFQNACQRIVQQRKGTSPNNTASVPLGRLSSSSCNTNPGTPAVHQQHNNYSQQQQHGYHDLNQQLYKPTYTHHQRSVSAVPTQDQLPSSRSSNGGQEAVRRRITNPCTSSATSTFYQRPLSPTEQHNKHHYTHRDNPYSFERGADTRSCSTFLMNSTPMPNSSGSNRVSNPEFAGISPAYSHNNLASQYSFANGSIPPQYSRSSSSVVGVDQVSGSSNTLVNSSYVASTSQLPPQHTTPSSTPNTQRKNRRISNIFRPNKGGRAIPIKQGLLYKRSSKALNKDWKKKYVCLYSDGRLSYHQNLKEYMDKDSRGKEVYLGLATVRVAGRQKRDSNCFFSSSAIVWYLLLSSRAFHC
uniref:PH domain-containing protein n=1 Tax=Ditylenchus dipsaci TaxID=166011 RepID=A0A915CLV2_9BILA